MNDTESRTKHSLNFSPMSLTLYNNAVKLYRVFATLRSPTTNTSLPLLLFIYLFIISRAGQSAALGECTAKRYKTGEIYVEGNSKRKCLAAEGLVWLLYGKPIVSSRVTSFLLLWRLI